MVGIRASTTGTAHRIEELLENNALTATLFSSAGRTSGSIALAIGVPRLCMCDIGDAISDHGDTHNGDS